MTPIDILDAIAGKFPDEDNQPAVQSPRLGGCSVDGATIQISRTEPGPQLSA